MATVQWKVGQTVEVQSRTWAGINKPGGCAKITKINYNGNIIDSLDVKYTVGGGSEKQLDPSIVSMYELLERGGRKRRGRDFLMERAEDIVKKISRKKKTTETTTTTTTTKQKPKKKASGKKKKRQQLHKTDDHTKTSPDSTHPSTEVTPEQKAANMEKKTTAKNKSPPLDYVSSDHAVEVSPLDPSSTKKSNLSAARGLFGSYERKLKAGKKAASKASKTETEDRKPTAITHKKKVKRAEAGSKPKQPPFKYKVTTAKAPDNLNIACRTLPQEKKFATQPILQFPRPKPSNLGAKAGNRTALRDVYDYECQKAKKFVDEVVGTHDDCAEASKENFPKTSATIDKKEAPPSRYDQFLSIFRSLRMKFDEGLVEELEFRELVNQRATQKFSADEIDIHVQKLCDDGKVMKSDGTIYIID